MLALFVDITQIGATFCVGLALWRLANAIMELGVWFRGEEQEPVVREGMP